MFYSADIIFVIKTGMVDPKFASVEWFLEEHKAFTTKWKAERARGYSNEQKNVVQRTDYLIHDLFSASPKYLLVS